MSISYMKSKLITLALLCAQFLVASAQNSFLLADKHNNNIVRAENMNATQVSDRTVVAFDLILDSLHVPSNRYRAFTPILLSADNKLTERLKTVIVSGRRQDIVFQRDGIDPLYKDNCISIRRHGDKPQTVNYTDAIAFQPWHKTAEILMECDLCGCGDSLSSERVMLGKLEAPLAPVKTDIDPYSLICLHDIVPVPQKKIRNLHGTAYVTFVVNRWEILPNYMNNIRELRKITDTLDVMVADKNISVRQVKIHGWASPESPYEHNKMLATNRAKALTDYVSHLYDLPANVFAPADATPENWIGLKAAVVEMDEQTLPHRQQILATIDKVMADIDNNITNKADRDELSIRSKYPAEYQYLLKNVYPELRRSDYEISFDFRDFTLEEAIEIYKTKPYQLSLRELWDVAQTMEQNSPEYNKVMQMAMNIYPDDSVALLNLANVAIRQKDLLKAETLLERAGDSAEALNTRATVAILQKRYDDARTLLDKAEQQGLDVKQNREAINILTKQNEIK